MDDPCRGLYNIGAASEASEELALLIPSVQSAKRKMELALPLASFTYAPSLPLPLLKVEQSLVRPRLDRLAYRVTGMNKVHPNTAFALSAPTPSTIITRTSSGGAPEVLTVWRKSLLLNCNGFTVFDCKGNLVFRVDNYVAGHRGEIVLMDASGRPLLTIRRKRLSLGDNWQVFDGETTINPRFTARKQSNLLNSKCLAQVSCGSGSPSSPSSAPSSPSSSWRSGGRSQLAYEIEGSYAQRSCTIYDHKRRIVAEIKPKEYVGADVFRLFMQPSMIDPSVAMAVVILLDQMFGSSRRF
ncbi:hypothetical protein SAY86_028095 [Trapa natans]|uniref:Protein LURP-one-related 8 n=1 Tax=Trapa natans TaxID=22666 RepID=A0AAN7R8C4_TRANT|nr:hypothetical protein SAY86_028095 [Trapa natans]